LRLSADVRVCEETLVGTALERSDATQKQAKANALDAIDGTA